MENNLQQSIAGGLLCKNCHTASVRVGKETEAFKISYICNCGELVFTEYNLPALKRKASAEACREGDKIICPVCRRELISINDREVRSLAFNVKCACGREYDKQRHLLKRTRKVGTYAILSSSET